MQEDRKGEGELLVVNGNQTDNDIDKTTYTVAYRCMLFEEGENYSCDVCALSLHACLWEWEREFIK